VTAAAVTRRLRVRGRVQGVGYRESMRREAVRLGVTGWVRNRLDGSVEAMVQGSAEQVAAILEWAHRGPAVAMVLRLEEEDGEGRFAAFEQRPTL
jgi:acylphosphatase